MMNRPILKQARSPNCIGGAHDWTPILRRYREPDSRGVLEIFITAVPFALLWMLMWASLGLSYWLTLIIAVPTAGFLVRLFMIQHDCGHGAFFRRRWANDWLGRAIGVVTLTPHDHCRRSHAIHHASSGNLERRGIGDIDTLTVREYLGLSRWRRLGYRLYRHPAVMFGVGPAFLFLVQHRLPAKGSSWSLHEAALHGSSHNDLPVVMRWFTANIGIHHVHHLCSRIEH
jgi:acyl-lipid omega-6 desaturase (Delta-12 desaturase)